MLGRIAIHLSDDQACKRRIDAGLLLAKQHNAQVVGVHPVADLVGRYASVLPQDVRDKLRQQDEQNREATRDAFLDAARAAQVKAEWRAPRGSIEAALALHARYCDLLVMSKFDSTDQLSGILPNLPESVIMAAGRPVLMIPSAGQFETIGQRVLYCWDQRREAARAFTDAAPILSECQKLVVLEVDRDEGMLDEQDIHEDDFSRYCAALGYPEPRRLVRHGGELGVGYIILNTASDTGSDLIVMGAYGHSRMRQWVMGGASRVLLSSMTVPVLLSQ